MRIKDWYCPTCKKFRRNYIDAIPKDEDVRQPCCKSCTTPLVNIRKEVEKITKKADEEHVKKILAKYESKSSEEKIPTFKTVPSSPMSYCEPTLGPISESTSFFSEEELLKIRDILDEYINDINNNDINNKEATVNSSLPNKSITTECEKPLTMAERDALEINGEGNCKESKNTTNKANKIDSLNFKGLMYTQKQIDALPPGSVYVVKVQHENWDTYLNYVKTSETNSELLGEYDYFDDPLPYLI